MKRILIIILLLNSINAFSQVFWPEKENLAVDSTGEYGTFASGPGHDLSVPTQPGDTLPQMDPDESNLKSGSDEPNSSGEGEFVAFPSPNSASLLNLQGDDINIYQGRITQTFPLADLKSYDISVPVILNYSSSGVKVDELSGWVGAGWNLSAGGQITRIVKGLPDEYNGKIRNRAHVVIHGGNQVDGVIPALGYLRLVQKFKSENKDPYNYMGQTSVMGLTKEGQEELIKNAMLFDDDISDAWDTQPDMFYYNFGGYSGNFAFDSDGKLISIPSNNFKISYQTQEITTTLIDLPPGFTDVTTTYTIITSFDVITEDGTNYRFGNDDLSAVELSSFLFHNKIFYYRHYENRECRFYPTGTLDYYTDEESFIDENGVIQYYVRLAPNLDPDENLYDIGIIPDFSSTWHLKEIISPSRNSVTFNYDKNPNKLNYIADQNETYSYSELKYPYARCTASPLGIAWQALSISKTKVTHDNIVLSSIEGSNGHKIVFTSQADRPDLINGKRLMEILVYANNNRLIKSFDFEYENVRSNEPRLVRYELGQFLGSSETRTFDIQPLYQTWFPDAEAYKRSEESRFYLKSLSEVAPYTSSLKKKYQFDYYDQNLPPRFSPKQDKWGYHNNYQEYYPMCEVYAQATWSKIYNINGEEKAFGCNSKRNASPDENKMKNGMLKSITYPTGGKKEFQYEKNYEGYGGLRISHITMDYGDNHTETTDYEYVGQDFTERMPSAFSSWYYKTDLYAEDDLKLITLYSAPTFYVPNNVGYPRVTIKDFKGGKTVYQFKTSWDDIDAIWDKINGSWTEYNYYYPTASLPFCIYDFPFQVNEDFSWKRGHLVDVYTHSNTGIIKHTHNHYEAAKSPSQINWSFIQGNYPLFEIEKRPESIKYTKFTVTYPWHEEVTEEGDKYVVKNDKAITNLRVRFIKHLSDNLRLTKSIETTYDASYPGDISKAVVNVTEYDHNLKNLQNEEIRYNAEYISGTETRKLANSDEYKTEYRYPEDFSDNLVLKSMNRRNMLKPIEVVTYKNNKVINASISNYFCNDCQSITLPFVGPILFGPILPREKYTLENNISLTDYEPATSSLILDDRLKPKNRFDEYDNKGNLLQAHEENGNSISYVWAYNQSYPITKIENATYQNVKDALAAIGSSIETIESLSIGANDDKNLRTLFEELRNASNTSGSILYNAQITSYTYDPLTGIKSMTDPNGITTYYEYDDLGRLKQTKDAEGNVLVDYTYQYKDPEGMNNNYSDVKYDDVEIGYYGSSFEIYLTAYSNWSISDDNVPESNWLTVSPSSGNESGKIRFNYSTNNGATRTATVAINYEGVSTKTFKVTQAAHPPFVNTNVSNITLGDIASSTSFNISSNCTWTISTSLDENNSWLSVSPGSGSNNSAVTMTYEQNPNTSYRYAKIFISYGNGQVKTININQKPLATLTTSVESIVINTANTVSKSFDITSNCDWTVSCSAPFIKVSPTSGSHNGTVTVQGYSGMSSSQRVNVTITYGSGATKIIPVTLIPTNPYLSVSPSPINCIKETSSTVININSNLPWTLSSSVPWLSFNPSSGINSGSVTVTSEENHGIARPATINIQSPENMSWSVQVNQEGIPPALDLNVTNITIDDKATSSGFTITSNCNWSIRVDGSWLTVSHLSGSGNGSITLSCSKNTGSSNRPATISVDYGDGQTKTISVVQERADPVLTTSLNDIVISTAYFTTKTFDIAANCNWTISNNNTPWLTVSPTSGSYNGTITVQVPVIPSYSYKSNITISYGDGLAKIIPVTAVSQTHSLSVSPNPVNFQKNASSTNISITSSLPWQLSCTEPWVSINTTSGINNGTVTVSCGENTGFSRSASLRITSTDAMSWNIPINQAGSEPVLNVTSLNLEYGASTSSFNITSACNWTVSDNASWITVSPTNGNNNGTVTVSCTANTSTSSRTGTVSVNYGSGLSKTVTVTQAGAAPVLNLSISSIALDDKATSSSFNITSNCVWTISENAIWLTVNPTNGTNNSTVTLASTINTSASIRTATISIAYGSGQTKTLTIIQDRVDPILSTSRENIIINPSRTLTEEFTINANCNWTIVNNTPWLKVNPTSGSNNRTITVEGYNATSSASANIKINYGDGLTKTVSITQLPTSANASISPNPIQLGKDAASTTFAINSNIPWTLSSDNWVSFSPSSGMNNGTVTLTYNQNTGYSRTASIHIQVPENMSWSSTVNQAGVEPVLNLASLNYGAGASSSSFTVTSACSWTVSDNASWITVSPTNGNNNGTVTVSCTANTSTSSRTGTVSVNYGSGLSKTVTVIQAGAPAPYLNVSTTNIGSISGMGSSFTINSNTNWQITKITYAGMVNPNFIVASPTSGAGNKYVSVRLDYSKTIYYEGNSVGTIFLEGGGLTVYIRFTNPGIPNPPSK